MSTRLRKQAKMLCQKRYSKGVNLAFDTPVNTPCLARVVNRVYYPWIQGYIYTPFDSPVNAMPLTPPILQPVNLSTAETLSGGLSRPLSDRSRRPGAGRGWWRAVRNTQRILSSSWLEYFSTMRLVFMSSVLLVFRAAQAAVVPSVPLKTVRRNFKRGCRRFA